MTELVAVVMIFSIPLAAIFTSYKRSQTKLQYKMIKEQVQLEKLKQENFLLETEKMKNELRLSTSFEEKEEVLAFIEQEKQHL